MFHLFPLLPKELRLHIWTLASFISQDTIAVIYPLASSSTATTTTTSSRSSSKFESLTPHFRACTPVPAILHTSFESRTTALQFYTRLFPDRGGKEDGRKSGKGSERIIYINKSVDTVIICLPTFRHVIEGVAGELLLGKMKKRGVREEEEAGTGARRREVTQGDGKQMLESAPPSPPSSSPWTKGEMMRSFAWRDSFPNDSPALPANKHHPQKDIFIVLKPFNRKTHLFTDATQDLHRQGLTFKNLSSTYFEKMGDWDVNGGWDRSWGDLFEEMVVQRERGDGWEDVDD